MNRPWILQSLPDRLSTSVFFRYYRTNYRRWTCLYGSAPLRYAHGVTMELVPGDVISDCIAFTGVYEHLLSRRVAHLAKAGGTMVDIGANLGYYSLIWAAGNSENKCIAFEASPRNIDILRRNIGRNGFDSQIEVISSAAGKNSGSMQFDPGPTDQTGWGGFAAADCASSIEVNVVRVDEVLPADTAVTLLKVDTEGADTWVLMGCDKLLRSQSVREIWWEQHKPRMRSLGVSLGAAEVYIRSVGYAPHPLKGPSTELVQWRAVPAERAAA